jgi:hypothetical protein
MGSQRVQPNTVLALDLSDIRKEYARKMEHLATVRDGSTGELHQGYWLCDVTGAEGSGPWIVAATARSCWNPCWIAVRAWSSARPASAR